MRKSFLLEVVVGLGVIGAVSILGLGYIESKRRAIHPEESYQEYKKYFHMEDVVTGTGPTQFCDGNGKCWELPQDDSWSITATRERK